MAESKATPAPPGGDDEELSSDDAGTPTNTPPWDVGGKIREILHVFRLSEAEFAHEVGMSPSHVNRLLGGERGKEGASPRLKQGAERALGVRQKYWDTPPTNIAQCLTEEGWLRVHQAEREELKVLRVLAAQESMLRIAAERGDHAVTSALVLAKPPPDADWPWWVRFYLDALDAARAKDNKDK